MHWWSFVAGVVVGGAAYWAFLKYGAWFRAKF